MLGVGLGWWANCFVGSEVRLLGRDMAKLRQIQRLSAQELRQWLGQVVKIVEKSKKAVKCQQLHTTNRKAAVTNPLALRACNRYTLKEHHEHPDIRCVVPAFVTRELAVANSGHTC